MMPTWERRLYAAALVATPLLALAEYALSARVLPRDFPYTVEGRVALLQAIHAHAGLWRADCFVALALGLVMVAASVGLLKLVRGGAPRLSVALAPVLMVGAIGMCLHAVFWNLVHGTMAQTADLPAMADFIFRTEEYPPFWAALVTVIVFTNAGLLLAALALGLSRTVPWWVALCAAADPLNDLFGDWAWLDVVTGVAWVVGWGMAGLALLRRRDEQPRASGRTATRDRSPVTV